MEDILTVYLNNIIKRYDDDDIIFYYSVKDFPTLIEEKFSFKTKENNLVQGFIYYYPNFNKEELIVFSHGLNGGHRSYLKEIEYLCKSGYKVVTYDAVGCFESCGDNIIGITEGINVLKALFSYIISNESLSICKYNLIGHSWGAFSIGAFLNIYTHINKVVLLSPFDSIKDLGLCLYKNEENSNVILNFEKVIHKEFASLTVSDGIMHSGCKTLIIQSSDDNIIDINNGLVKISNNGVDAKYFITSGKNHNPNYTKDAVNYMNIVFDKYISDINLGILNTFSDKKLFMSKVDFDRMTKQDDKIWSMIIGFLNEDDI